MSRTFLQHLREFIAYALGWDGPPHPYELPDAYDVDPVPEPRDGGVVN